MTTLFPLAGTACTYCGQPASQLDLGAGLVVHTDPWLPPCRQVTVDTDSQPVRGQLLARMAPAQPITQWRRAA